MNLTGTAVNCSRSISVSEGTDVSLICMVGSFRHQRWCDGRVVERKQWNLQDTPEAKDEVQNADRLDTSIPYGKFVSFVIFSKNWRTNVHFWGHWYPSFGLLVTSPLGFKPRVGSLIHTSQSRTWYTLPEIHMVGFLLPVETPEGWNGGTGGAQAGYIHQGGHGTGKTGNLVLTFSRQGKHREFCFYTGKNFETQSKYFSVTQGKI